MTRPLYAVANEVRLKWRNVHYAAKPYLEAMLRMNKVDDKYGCDSGVSVVLYFLSNAATWRGEDARRIKAELNAMVKGK